MNVLRNFLILLIVLAVLIGLRLHFYPDVTPSGIVKTGVQEQSSDPEVKTSDSALVEIVADNLEVPWSLVFISNDELLFTERGGKVKIKNLESNEARELLGAPSVKVYGEGGLLGAEIHPDFKRNKFVYLYYTYTSDGDNTLNRVSRYRLDTHGLVDQQVIVDDIPGSIFHNGGRIKFGPDGYLYITAGDARVPSLAQDKNSLAGKILRVTESGDPVADNPFDNRTYSYGHRNPQGLAWDGDGNLWATEHGNAAHDEINFIEKGKNYGWPTITGTQKSVEMETPTAESGAYTWAPSGMVYYKNSLYFAGLKGTALFKAQPMNDQVKIETLFKDEFGRIRDVIQGPDGLLYIATNNKDGRGIPKKDDDKIIRINLEKL